MSGREDVLGSVRSVRTGRIQSHERPDWDERRTEWRTAYWKDEVALPVHAGALGLVGDEQADKQHHGGPHMALLMYAAAHYEHWRSLAGLEGMGPGGFGENLTVAGCDETQVCVGDVLELGSSRLQVASPRGPCADISRRWNAEWLLKRVVELRRTGWYLRVLEAGELGVGDTIRLLERPHAGWTIDRLLRLRHATPRDRGQVAAAAALEALAPDWREAYAKLAGQGVD